MPAHMISFISNDSTETSTKEDQSQIAYHISQYRTIEVRTENSSEESLSIESSSLSVPTKSTSLVSKSSNQSKSSSTRRKPGRPKKYESFLVSDNNYLHLF